MKTILITGGCGFIGSNYVHYFRTVHPECTIVNLDALTYAGNKANLTSFANDPRYVFIQGNICDQAAVTRLFAQYDFDAVVHFAAESHVDRSITGPAIFVTTNVLGTQILLDAARTAWAGKWENKRFVHVSTDEVYGSLGATGLFSEETPLAPNSPYSASKTGSDLLVRAYFHTFGFPSIITRCSNNYGRFQFPEKLIPLIVLNALRDMPLPVYGDGANVRDWLHVGDHCSAIDTVLARGRIGEVYNIGGNSERRNIEIVKTILAQLGKPESLITYVPDRLGHDRRYAIDASKIKNELGWSPQMTFVQGISETVTWYCENTAWWNALLQRPKS